MAVLYSQICSVKSKPQTFGFLTESFNFNVQGATTTHCLFIETVQMCVSSLQSDYSHIRLKHLKIEMNTGCSLFHQSEDFMMIRLKPHIPPSSVRSRRALCAPKLEPPSPPFPKKKEKSLRKSFLLQTMKGFTSCVFVCLRFTHNIYIRMSEIMPIFFRWKWILPNELMSRKRKMSPITW